MKESGESIDKNSPMNAIIIEDEYLAAAELERLLGGGGPRDHYIDETGFGEREREMVEEE